MGYYTTYDLSITPEPEEGLLAEEVDGESLRALSSADGMIWNSKWYHMEEDMTALSARWPGYLFRLHGEGEERGDAWVYFFKAGECDKHHMPEWDPPEDPRAEWLAQVSGMNKPPAGPVK